MTLLSEQLSAVRKSQWEAQLDMFRALSTRALDSTEQLIALNMNTSRRSMEQAAGTFRQMLDVRDPRDLLALGTAAQGQWQQLFSYGRDLLGIATGNRVQSWSTVWTTLPLAAPAPSVPRLSAPPVLEQAAIATAEATTVVSEIAAAATESGSALAEATLDAGQQAVSRATGDAAQPQQPQQQPAAPVDEPTELEAEKTNEAPSEQPAGEADDAGATVDGAPSVVTKEAAADPIDAVIAEEAPPAKAKPLARALNKVAPKPLAAGHPLASTVPLEANGHVALPIVTPVESTPPLHMPAQEGKPARASRKK
ncbi:phasin family protein [Massilia sp. TN1-12]|uniref:phasin family protein n=1 Tax=Massilia paldalensis TaxID=3377675 RepID=UPI00384F8380